MYDKQGNFRNKDNLKGYNLKKPEENQQNLYLML